MIVGHNHQRPPCIHENTNNNNNTANEHRGAGGMNTLPYPSIHPYAKLNLSATSNAKQIATEGRKSNPNIDTREEIS